MARWTVLVAALFIPQGVYSQSPCYNFKALSHGVNACACPGDTLMYQCSNTGNTSYTIWGGNALKCRYSWSYMILYHQRCCTNYRSCNRGATTAQLLRYENSCYTSQLNITIESRNKLDNETVSCVTDNGATETVIGQAVITPTANFTAPPATISVNDDQYRQLTFSWDDQQCDRVNHNIIAFNCGDCPATSISTSVTCTDVPRDGTLCRFAVQRVMCGNIAGNVSGPVIVKLKGDLFSVPQVISLLAVSLTGVVAIFVIYTITTLTIIVIQARRKASHQTHDLRGRVNNAPRQEREEAMYEQVNTRKSPANIQTQENVAYK